MSETIPEEQPSEASLRSVLAQRTSELEALRKGASLVVKTAGPGLVVLLLYCVGGAIGGSLAGDWGELLVKSPPAESSSFASILGGVVVFLGIYIAIQVSKASTASRQSWWPALFFTPCLAVLGAYSAVGSQFPTQIVPGLTLIGWDLLWESFAGAAALFAWVSFGNAVLEGTAARADEVLSQLQKRLTDVAVVHGAKTHAVTIGLQLILPGIFYALSLAFADMIVTLDPGRKALRRSSQLTYGMRGRLFRLLFIVFVITVPLTLLAWTAIDGLPDSGWGGRIAEFAMSPSSASGPAMAAQRLVGGLSGWFTAMAMLVLYREREAQVAAKRALKKLSQAESA